MVLVEQQARHEIRPPLVFPLEARLILQEHDDLPVRLDDGRDFGQDGGRLRRRRGLAGRRRRGWTRLPRAAGVAPAPGLADALADGWRRRTAAAAQHDRDDGDGQNKAKRLPETRACQLSIHEGDGHVRAVGSSTSS